MAVLNRLWMRSAALVSLIAVAALLTEAGSLLIERRDLETRRAALDSDPRAAERDRAFEVPADFAIATLAASPAPMTSELYRSAAAAGIDLQDLRIRSTPATPTRLGTTAHELTAVGSYAGLKDFLRRLVEPGAGRTLTRLRLQEPAEGAALATATLTLTVWSPPAAAPLADDDRGGSR